MRGLRVWTKRARQAKQAKRAKLAERRAQLAMIAAALGFASCGVWDVGAVATAQETATGAGRSLAVVAKKPEKSAVLLVGVDSYVADEVLPRLQHASSDVKKLREALTDKIGFASESIRMFVSDGGPGERPQREAIMAAFDEILAASGPESTVVVALSGHGFETENGDAAFCPEDVEAKFDGEKTVVNEESAILIKDVAKKLEDSRAGFKLLIVDACRNPIGKPKSASGARSFSRVADPKGVAFLQSCASGQISYEHPDLKGGVFTHYFTEGLKGAADLDGDGGFTFNDVCDYAKSQTKRFVDDEFREKQTPFTTSSFTDFWLKKPGVVPPPPPSTGWLPFALLTLTGGAVVFAVWTERKRRQMAEALAAARRADADKLASEALSTFNLGGVANVERAIELMTESLALVDLNANRCALKTFEEALAALKVAERKTREAERKASEAWSAFNLGGVANVEKAIRLMTESLALVDLSANRRALKTFEEKLKELQEAASGRANADKLASEAWSAFNLGGVANVEKAIRLMKESLALVDLSANRRALKTFEEKLKELQEAASGRANADKLASEAWSAFNLGGVANVEKAIRLMKESLALVDLNANRCALKTFEEKLKELRKASVAASNGWSAEYKAGTRKTLQIKGVEYAFRYCPPGTFPMGSPESEEGRCNNETQHEVTLTNGFWLLETPVTQAMWKSVMGSNPSYFNSNERNPVDSVSWNDCQDFIKKLNSEGLALGGFKFRLPTEAEWEYACRAGTTTAYSWGDSLNGDKANCDGNYPCGTSTKGKYLKCTTKVGSYGANPWGLYDMHGNVCEWCEDLYTDYKNMKIAQKLIGVILGSLRVLRGGSWGSFAKDCRSAYRFSIVPAYRGSNCGFRLALGREL